AHPRLIQGSGAAAVCNLHASAKDKRPDKKADTGRAERGAQIGGKCGQQRHGYGGSKKQQKQLRQHTAGISLFDQATPAGGESEPGPCQHAAHAYANQEQDGLAYGDGPGKENKKCGHDGREWKTFHERSQKVAVPNRPLSWSRICWPRPGTLSMGSAVGEFVHSAREAGYSLTLFCPTDRKSVV